MNRRSRERDELVAEYQNRFIDMLRMQGALSADGLESAFRATPRHRFVHHYLDTKRKKPRMVKVNPDRPSATQLERIYSNEALTTHRPPGPLSTISQPSLVGHTLRQMRLEPGMRVLEIGAGTGWNAALMGRLVGGSGSVTTVELHPAVARQARRALRAAGPRNVKVVTRDGANGHASTAPFDRIVATVGSPDVFDPWMTQLKERGLLVLPLQAIPHGPFCLLAALRKTRGHVRGDAFGPAWFIRLEGPKTRGRARTVDAQDSAQQSRGHAKARKHLAPWACVQPGARRFYRDMLMMMAHLEGMSVTYSDKAAHVASQHSDGTCRAEESHVEVRGDSSTYEELLSVTERWLSLGAPGPGLFRVEVWPSSARKRKPKDGWLVRREHCQIIFRLKQ